MPRHKLDKPNYRLRRRGRLWAIDWTDEVTGRTRSVSTGAEERAAAEIWRDQWIAGREQPLPPAQPRVAEILNGYMAVRLPKIASKQTMQFSAMPVIRHVGNLEPRMLDSETYISRRALDRVSDGTVRREVGTLRAALAWAVKKKWITAAPYVEMPPRPAPRDRWLTKEEVDRLIQSASSPHMRLFIVLAYHTAARAGAIVDLTWDRVDLERKLITYDRPGRQRNKKRRAVVPINRVALAELQSARIVAVSDHVIEFRGKPVLSIKPGFHAACRRAEIAECSPHVLRHSSAYAHGRSACAPNRDRPHARRHRKDGRAGVWQALAGLPAGRSRCAGRKRFCDTVGFIESTTRESAASNGLNTGLEKHLSH